MILSLAQAIAALQNGQVVGVPTETVYGLAARMQDAHAVQDIFRIKGRPLQNPLIIHIAHLKDLEPYVLEYPPQFYELAKAFWPGPLTCILPIRQETILSLIRAGLPTAGFRIPAHPLIRSLIESTGPLVIPSANLSGKPSSTQPAHIYEDLGEQFPVLDGGECVKGLESTILLYKEDQWIIIRLGSLAPEDFLPILGYQPCIINEKHENQPICPGQHFRHYAPKARLILGNSSNQVEKCDASYVLGFQERSYPQDKQVFLLGSLNKPETVAKNLYARLRQLDEAGATQVWVDMDFPSEGLWLTIQERLTRASDMH